jgi:competence protein ComEC
MKSASTPPATATSTAPESNPAGRNAAARKKSRATRYQPLILVSAMICAGIAADRLFPLAFEIWLSTAVMGLCIWFALWRKHFDRLALLPLAICLAGVGGAWHHLHWYLYHEEDLGAFVADRDEPLPVCVEVIACSAPRLSPAPPVDPLRATQIGDRSRLEVEAVSLRDGQTWRKVFGSTELVVEGHLLGVHAGDHLRVTAMLFAMPEPQNPGEFDFAQHARVDRRRCQLRAESPACVVVMSQGGWSVYRVLDGIRHHGNALLWRNLAPQRAGLASALLLGERAQMDVDLANAFFETGTVHLLSISGLHIGILAGYLFFGLRMGLLRRGIALAAVAIVIVLYAYLINAEPPAVRATILVLLVCLAAFCNRRPLAFNCLAAAALVVLAWNPAELFRVGTQLSFLAMAVLAWFGPLWNQWQTQDQLDRLIDQTRPWPIRGLKWTWLWVWRTTLVSCAVWFVTLPLVIYQFHILSPISIVLTPVLSFPVAVGLISGFGVLLFGSLVPPLGAMCGWVCDGCLRFLEWLVTFSGDKPLSHYWVSSPPGWWVLGFYVLLAAWTALPRVRPGRKWSLILLVGWIAMGAFGSWLEHRRSDELVCTFLSVGHGCAVVVEFPEGQTLLYDAGQLGSPTACARTISGYLWYRGIRRLDTVVLSHADLDHYNGLPQLLRRFSVGEVVISPYMRHEDTPALRTLFQSIETARVPLRQTWAGQHLELEHDVRIEVLHPPQATGRGSDNAKSIVLAIEYAGRRLLLPGDLETPGMEQLFAGKRYDYDIVLAPHHGSARSDPPGFAAWSHPEWVIISGGSRQDPSVARAYEASGAKVLRTSEAGAVTVRLGKNGIRVETMRKEKLLMAN